MDANPTRTARGYLDAAPLAKWGALAASVAAAVSFALLLPVVYLFVDLLAWRGAVASYPALTAQRQAEFRAEWDGGLGDDEGVKAALARIRPADADGLVGDIGRWNWRWQAATYHTFQSRVSQEAADAYLTLPEAGKRAEATPTLARLGVLSTVARERPRWTTGPLCWLARNAGWAWRPADDAGANTPYLAGLFVIAFLLVAVHVGSVLTAEHLAALASVAAVGKVRRELFAHAGRLGSLAVRQQSADEAGDLVTRKADAIGDGLRGWLLYGWRTPAAVALILLVLFVVNPLIAACLVLLGGLVWLVAGQLAAWLRRDARFAARRTEARLAQMRESVTMMRLVKCYLMERFSQTRVERQLADHGRIEWRRLRGDALARPALLASVAFAGVAVLYLAGRAVLVGDMSLAGLATKLVAVAGLVAAIGPWLDARVRMARAAAGAAAASEFFDRRTDPGQPIDAEFLQPMRKRLELTEVSVREPGTGRMLLDAVTAVVPAGMRVAVVGDDPDELRTFAHLLTRFVEPTGGEVRMDGKNTRWVTLESLRTQVGLASAGSLVFSDTVANNIGCGDPGFAVPQVIEAAKAAHAHQFVQRLPYGYETPVGDGGHSLKLGEQMRIALARAILRDPTLLLVEEPDEPIDADSQALIDDTYERVRGGRTVVVVTRRGSVLRNADRVFVLHRGKLAAAGSHDELMQSSDVYRHLLFKEALVAV